MGFFGAENIHVLSPEGAVLDFFSKLASSHNPFAQLMYVENQLHP